MTKLKVLYIDTERVWRGGQEQLSSLIVGMKQRGLDVSLAAPPAAPLALRLSQRGIRCFPFCQRHELGLPTLRRLLNLARRRAFDIVHFNTPRPILLGGLAARLAGVPITVASRRVNFPLRSSLSRFKYNWMLDSIFTVSRSIRDTLVDQGVDPALIEVVYEGVDLAWIDSLPLPRLPRPKQGQGPVVGMVAHLSPEKGHDTLLRAAARLKSEFPTTTYVLVGEGKLEPRLRQEVERLELSKSVSFTGFRSDSEALMKQFDLFCLPSLSEGLSSAILAAMANRLPVIATRVGGIPELVVDGETGLLVPVQDVGCLTRSLATLLKSESVRRRMGARGRRRIETNFTLKQKLDQSTLLYRRLLESKRIR
ncbi:MAG: glycosyltransferase family 4 protein [Acidobacteriota bacterium]